MRKPSLITAILLLSSVWVIAQSSSTPPTVPDNSQANQPASASQQPDAAQQKQPMGTGNEQSLEGCISRGAVGYTLTDNAGKTYQLAGDTSKLADEVGHWDRVSGSQEGGAASAGAPTTFTVTKVKVVSTTCPTK
jgi:hypothetical protein